MTLRGARPKVRATLSPAGEIEPHSGECGSTPKEQPPPETLRQKDRGDMQLWKAAEPVPFE
ncbi:hypothetical protein DLREEDagr8_16720 [Dongia sp. agr-C8]